MNDTTLKEFIRLVEQVEMKDFTCDITSKRIIFHFSDEHQRIYLSEVKYFISELNNIIPIQEDKIQIIKEFKYLELWIPFKDSVSEIENLDIKKDKL